jgi:lipopolysaccharide export system protein LptC
MAASSAPAGIATPAPTPARQPWPWRLWEVVSAYLPLLLMALLALATWWLVRATPEPEAPRPPTLLAGEPDYTMQRFLLQQFGADGRLRLQVEGAVLHHFPDADRIEMNDVRARAIGDDGSLTLARARQAVTNGAGTELQLLGGAEVTHTPADGGVPIEFRGEFLHAFIDTQRLRSHLPVTLVQGRDTIRAATLEADNKARTATLGGPLVAELAPPSGRR